MKRIVSIILAVLTLFTTAFAANIAEDIVDTSSTTTEEAYALNPTQIAMSNSVGIVLTETDIQEAKAALQKLQEEIARKKAAEEAARKEAERVAYVNSQKYTYNVFSITGLSVDEFNKLLAPYALAGNGQALYDMEHTYGVNGIFCMSVAMIESSLGGYGPSRNSHNYWGILGRSWSSDYAGIMGFGDYIKNSGYYNGKSIESIAYIYCPPTASKWAANVKSFMNTLWSRV